MNTKILRSPVFYTFSLCVLLWAVNEREVSRIQTDRGELALRVGLTPVERMLFFDYPDAAASLEKVIVKYKVRSPEDLLTLPPYAERAFRRAEKQPIWGGVAPLMISFFRTGTIREGLPMFEKIREGEVWRFFTPSLLHKDLFHLLFNMAWLLIPGAEIAKRIGGGKFILLILLIAGCSNTAQYLAGGPYFLGFSGVAAGLVGFVWMRQKKAPREGYLLPKATSLFVFYCILAMMFFEGVAYFLQIAFSVVIPINIANTAHVAGGMTGLLLGRSPLFPGRAE